MIKKLPDRKTFTFEPKESVTRFFRTVSAKQEHRGRKVAYIINNKTQKVESVIIYN